MLCLGQLALNGKFMIGTGDLVERTFSKNQKGLAHTIRVVSESKRDVEHMFSR